MAEWIEKWTVPSERNPAKTYTVSKAKDGTMGCSCPAWTRQFGAPQERQHCKHINSVLDGAYYPDGTPTPIPDLVPAQVAEVTVDAANNRVLVPLLPIGDTHFQATVMFDLHVTADIPWGHLSKRYDLAKRNTWDAVMSYIYLRGRKINDAWVKGRGWTGYKIVGGEREAAKGKGVAS